jgi:anti-sigma B factor antagonist
MEIVEQRQGAVSVVKPQGPLALGDADQFKATVTDVMTRSLGRMIVDASGIAYVDSRGLEVLVEVSDQLAETGRALRLCGTNDTLREVLDLTNLADKFEHFEDVNAAVRSFL